MAVDQEQEIIFIAENMEKIMTIIAGLHSPIFIVQIFGPWRNDRRTIRANVALR